MVEQEVVIRQSRRRDWRSLRLLFNRSFPNERPLTRLDAELWDTYRDIIVAELRDRIVGAAWVRHGWVWGICWLDFMAVDAEFRRRGVGRRLLREIDRIALTVRERNIGLSVLRQNAVALRLYQEMGFEIVTFNDQAHSLHRVIEIPGNPPQEVRPTPRRGLLLRLADRARYLVMTRRG